MWKEEDNRLKKSFTFRNFKEAFRFMTEIAFIADELDHHPFWTNSYNKVSFELNTHDAGNVVTGKDRNLAAAIDEIFKKFE
ncbi:pterin-4-alpha-carbinolamine dehydratase [Dyadobacter flavalbus]|uniref:4a-hydroxytetrahydrobiopterin dehydratase n=1 Tax=Dyadobacter flavalbus TaxID=2579942 RepID=A0A5M8R2G4_9BACT|nr:4a-hydroxytetrahydrobiopterin dehydratase [Dyadobacter flavalbus]KAA6441106.1 pterin-4-alpha-carbinolamine dehydratase [Dyadobacter flavalbus]